MDMLEKRERIVARLRARISSSINEISGPEKDPESLVLLSDLDKILTGTADIEHEEFATVIISIALIFICNSDVYFSLADVIRELGVSIPASMSFQSIMQDSEQERTIS